MEISQAKPFFWRLDWFPPDHAIRFCPDTKTVDSGDVFVVACATIGASRVANTTFFGDKNIEATARDHQFHPQVLRQVVWNGKGGRRRVVPVNVMKSIISKMKTPTSVKLYPDLIKIVDDINEGKLVPEVTEGTLAVSGGPSPANFPSLTAVDPGLFRINPYNQSVPFTENMIERAKKQKELTEVGVSFDMLKHKAFFETELVKADHDAKKRKIEEDSHYESARNEEIAAIKTTREKELEAIDTTREVFKKKLTMYKEFQALAEEHGFLNHSRECVTRADELWNKIFNDATLL